MEQAVAKALANEVKVKTPATVVTELLSQLFTTVTFPFVLKGYYYSVYVISVCKDNCDYRMFLCNHASKVLDPIFLEVKCFQNTMFM
jgi:hypothetical protein